jgi:hypothetical protein
MGSVPLAHSIGWVSSESQLRGRFAPVNPLAGIPRSAGWHPGLRFRGVPVVLQKFCRIFLTCDNAGLAGGFRFISAAIRSVCRYVGGPVPTGMFAEDQLERLRTSPDIGRDDLIRYLTFTPADVAFLSILAGAGAG